VSAARAGIAFYILFGVVYALGVTPMQALYPVEVLSCEQRAKGMAFSNLVVSAVALQKTSSVSARSSHWRPKIIGRDQELDPVLKPLSALVQMLRWWRELNLLNKPRRLSVFSRTHSYVGPSQ
jgi:hypothetical protein